MALVFRHAQWPQDTKLRIHEYSIDLATCTNTTSMVLDIHKMKKKKYHPTNSPGKSSTNRWLYKCWEIFARPSTVVQSGQHSAFTFAPRPTQDAPHAHTGYPSS